MSGKNEKNNTKKDLTKRNRKALKLSIYNDFIDIEERHYLINYLSGSIIELDNLHYEKLMKMQEDMDGEQDLLDEGEIDFLYSRGFLVENNFDEKEYLKYIWKYGFNPNALTLQIEPTLKCNFACVYCFEDGFPQITMSKEHQERLLRFVEKYMQREELSSLNVIWFGGEPLLVPHIVEELTQGFRQIFDKLGLNFETKYKANIVTNGSLLTEKIRNKLQEWRVTNIQITIDGSEKVHNLRRPFRGGKPSFDIVWKNFIDLLKFIHFQDLNIKVVLRINFSLDVKDEVTEVLDLIPFELRRHVEVTYKHYFPKSTEWAKPQPKMIPLEPVSVIESKLDYIAYQKGYKSVRLELDPKPFYCPSTTAHYFEVSPDLKIYKCNVAAGERPPIGEIDKDGNLIFNFPELLNWVNIDPFSDPECLNCKLLPICMGGCGFARLSGKKGCIVDKEHYKEVVVSEIKKIINKEDSK